MSHLVPFMLLCFTTIFEVTKADIYHFQSSQFGKHYFYERAHLLNHKTFRESRSFCDENGGQLVQIRSKGETAFISSYFTSDNIASNFCLGIEASANRTWIFFDKDPVQWFNWAVGQPDGAGLQTVAMFSPNGRWYDSSSDSFCTPLCEKQSTLSNQTHSSSASSLLIQEGQDTVGMELSSNSLRSFIDRTNHRLTSLETTLNMYTNATRLFAELSQNFDTNNEILAALTFVELTNQFLGDGNELAQKFQQFAQLMNQRNNQAPLQDLMKLDDRCRSGLSPICSSSCAICTPGSMYVNSRDTSDKHLCCTKKCSCQLVRA